MVVSGLPEADAAILKLSWSTAIHLPNGSTRFLRCVTCAVRRAFSSAFAAARRRKGCSATARYYALDRLLDRLGRNAQLSPR